MSKNRRHAYLALLFNALIWGAAFPIIKPVFEIISPTAYLFLRFLFAGIFSLPILIYYYLKIQPKISYIIKVLLIELLGLPIPLILLYTGLSLTSSLEASLIGSTGPIFITLGGIWFLHEKESKREWQGLALSLLGSIILIVSPIFIQGFDTPMSTIGNLYILGYNLLYTIYALIAKKTYKTRPPLYLGSLTYLGTALIYGLILAFQGSFFPLFENLRIFDLKIIFPVLYMAIPGGILAFALYLYAQSKIEVSEANLFTYLNGVVAIPAAYFLLGESPTWPTLIAIILIAYGVYKAEVRHKL